MGYMVEIHSRINRSGQISDSMYSKPHCLKNILDKWIIGHMLFVFENIGWSSTIYWDETFSIYCQNTQRVPGQNTKLLIVWHFSLATSLSFTVDAICIIYEMCGFTETLQTLLTCQWICRCIKLWLITRSLNTSKEIYKQRTIEKKESLLQENISCAIYFNTYLYSQPQHNLYKSIFFKLPQWFTFFPAPHILKSNNE